METMTGLEAANLILADNRRRVPEDDTGEEELLTNLKLQKLLYYAQGAFLALSEAPLFADDIIAWQKGPVAETVYEQYKRFDSGPTTEVLGPYAPEKLDRASKGLLRRVLDVFGEYEAGELINMTHKEVPWLDAWKQGPGTPLNKDTMKEYFLANHVEED